MNFNRRDLQCKSEWYKIMIKKFVCFFVATIFGRGKFISGKKNGACNVQYLFNFWKKSGMCVTQKIQISASAASTLMHPVPVSAYI